MNANTCSGVWVSEGLQGIGGSEYTTLLFGSFLVEAGWNISIVSPPGVLPVWKKLAQKNGIKIVESKTEAKKELLLTTLRQCELQNATFVTFIPWSALLSEWSKICPSHLATTALEPTSGTRACWWLPEPESAPVDILAVLNHAARAVLQERLGNETEVVVVPNCIFPTLPLSPPQEPNKIGCFSRFSEEKGIEFLLAAFKLISVSHNNVTLHLFGDGPDKDRLKRMTRMLEIDARVIFEGLFEPYFGLCSAASSLSIAVLPSLFEGQPVSLLELMTLGVPVISTRTSGAMSVLGAHYRHLVDLVDTRGLAEHMGLLLRSQVARTQAREWGYERAHEVVCKERTLKALLDFYEKALKKMGEKEHN